MLAVLGVMVYGAVLSFNYDPDTAESSLKPAVTKPVTLSSSVSAAILPHIDTAEEQRQKLLAELKSKTLPKRIIIVSVNHQNSGDGDILVYPEDWQVKNGTLKNDKEVYDSLIAAEIAKSDANAFHDEHGIKNVIDDIYLAFPKSLFTSLIIKDSTSQKTIQSLADFFVQGDKEAMIIASVDFSHYNPRALASVHDEYSIQALESQNSQKIWQAETDSPQALLLASEFAKGVAQSNFHLFSRGNSLDSSQNDDGESTSYVLGYYNGEKVEARAETATSFVFAGDAMFDRNVWHNYKDSGLDSIFSNLGTRVFRGVDLPMINLEGPISSKEIDDDYKSGSMVFNFPPVVPQVLKNLGIKAVSLANNHSSNAGASGFANTQKVLGNADISYIGRQTGFNADQDMLRQDGAVPMSIVAVDALAAYDESSFLATIKKEKAAGRFVIVFPHWGTEYKTTHDAGQRALAKKWIDAGANMIIGSHPHVVEDFEVIDGVPVVYSLGNFVFDQFFSEETQHGLMIAGTVSEQKISLTFLPTKEVLVKPELLTKEAKKSAIAKIFDIDSAQGFIKITSDTIEIERTKK